MGHLRPWKFIVPRSLILERVSSYSRCQLPRHDGRGADCFNGCLGVAHCPNANMRLGSGICRVPELIERKIKVGIGVDDLVVGGNIRVCDGRITGKDLTKLTETHQARANEIHQAAAFSG